MGAGVREGKSKRILPLPYQDQVCVRWRGEPEFRLPTLPISCLYVLVWIGRPTAPLCMVVVIVVIVLFLIFLVLLV